MTDKDTREDDQQDIISRSELTETREHRFVRLENIKELIVINSW